MLKPFTRRMRTELSPMRKLILATVFLCCLSLGGLFAQAPVDPAVIQDWKFLGEAPTSVDIDYRVVQCGAQPEIHLLVFNEYTDAQTLRFSLKISSGNRHFNKDYTVSLPLGAMYIGECNATGDLAQYGFTLPKGYDPKDLKVEIKFLDPTNK